MLKFRQPQILRTSVSNCCMFSFEACPGGFVLYKTNCYGFIKAKIENHGKTTRQRARAVCKEMRPNYDLVVIEDDTEYEFLTTQIITKFQSNLSFWIGMKHHVKDVASGSSTLGDVTLIKRNIAAVWNEPIYLSVDGLKWIDTSQYWYPENVTEFLVASSASVST